MSSEARWKDKLMVVKITSVFWHPKFLDIAVVGVKVKANLRKVTNNIEPPPLKWSAPIVRKRRTINGHQETQARRDCREVTAG